MSKSAEKVEFENERIKVTRVTVGPTEKAEHRQRRDRIIIWLADNHKRRIAANGKIEELHRKAGEVAWRDASKHDIHNLGEHDDEVIIVELK